MAQLTDASQVMQDDRKRSVKTKQIGTPGFQSESNKTDAYNYLHLQKERPRYMEQRQKLWDTLDNYISAEYNLYDWLERIIARTLKTGANVNWWEKGQNII